MAISNKKSAGPFSFLTKQSKVVQALVVVAVVTVVGVLTVLLSHAASFAYYM